MSNWLIYGANGHTGKLIAQEAMRRGHKPTIGGRSHDRIFRLSNELDLSGLVFSLDQPAHVAEKIKDFDAVLHCAGPYRYTYQTMLEACKRTGTHYLDITGEATVIEDILCRSHEIADGGIIAVPAVGFDVVPTDCLAAKLRAKCPDAESLELAFVGFGQGYSHGTLKTMIEYLPDGGLSRVNGELVKQPTFHATKKIPFPSGERYCAAIPWGDVSSAYFSTGIGNITVYSAVKPSEVQWSRRLGFARKLLKVPALKKKVLKTALKKSAKSSKKSAESPHMEIWGQVVDRNGHKVTMTLNTPEGYHFTADAAVNAVERLLSGSLKPGSYTPSRAFGADFVDQCRSVTIQELDP